MLLQAQDPQYVNLDMRRHEAAGAAGLVASLNRAR